MVNAFWLDADVEQAARWLVDRHVTSSVFECSMVLTTAVRLNGYPDADDLPVTHRDHPLTRWASESRPNWRRLRAYTEAAHAEWRYRWDHGPDETHGSWAVVRSLDEPTVRDLAWPTEAARDPPQVTGRWSAPWYVDAYRYYYANDKRHLFAWAKDRTAPPWIDDYTVDAGNGAPRSVRGREAAEDGERGGDVDGERSGADDRDRTAGDDTRTRRNRDPNTSTDGE